MAGGKTKRGAVHLQVSAARSAVLTAKSVLGSRRAKFDKLPGYSWREFLGLEAKLDELQELQRLLGEKDAAGRGTGLLQSLTELFDARATLLRRARADADLGGRIITPALVASVAPGSGARDAVGDVMTLAGAYLKPGAPKTPYTPAQLKALLDAAGTVFKQLGVKVRNLDRQQLADRRDALAAEIVRTWNLTVLATGWFNAVEGTQTALPPLTGVKRRRSGKKPAAPMTPPA